MAITGCGSSSGGGNGGGHAASGTSSVPLSLAQVASNLKKAGYRITVYTPNEGVLYIDSTHKADAGLSIDHSPSGQEVYGSVYQTADPGVRALLIKRNSDETQPIVRGDLVFTISGTGPELETIVKDAGDAGPSTAKAPPGSASDADAAKAAMQKFIDDYAAGAGKSVCASFTPQIRARSQTFCDRNSIGYIHTPDARVKQYVISNVTTSGGKATATVTFQGVTEQVALRKLGGQWKIDTLPGSGHLF